MPPTGIKKQKTFAHRRHISKPRSSLGSEKEKRQSSLTQLDFVSTPRTSDAISIPSDDQEEEEEEEVEEEDFAVERPRKRRRVSAKGSEGDDWTPKMSGKRSSENRSSAKARKRAGLEKGQQTMTQIDFVSSGQNHHVEDDIEDDEEPGRKDKQNAGPRKGGTRRTLPWLNEEHDENNYVPQSPVTDSRTKSPSKSMQPQPNLALHSIATYDFTTPKKLARHLEIPSSQSPPSIKLSSKKSQRSQRHLLGQRSPSRSPSKSPSKLNPMWRSPLKEKPANIASPRWEHETQESQNPTMKMLHQVRLRTRLGGAPLHEEAPMPPPKRPLRHDRDGKSQANKIPNTQLAPARTLKRTTTVQDSQASDENIMTQAPPLGSRRTHTIQDSQHEDLDMSSQLYRSLSSRENLRITDSQANNDDYDYNEEDYDEENYPQTYDPVSAALDRDAARYAWTQTQAPRTQHTTRTQIADSEDEDETDEDDLDRGVIPDSDSEDEIILLPSASKQGGRDRSQELCSDGLATPIPQTNDDPANQPRAQSQQKQISNSPPSSPPPLRPSQISTIMPTQSSPQHRRDSNSTRPADPPINEAEAQEFSPPTSPDPQRRIKATQVKDTQALTISSSPLPLPPWSSSGEVDLGLYSPPKGEAEDDSGNYSTNNELASLVDFSLPPPPPLGMSSSPWR